MFSQQFVIVKFREDKMYALLYQRIKDFPNVINGGVILVSSECTIISMLLCLKMNYEIIRNKPFGTLSKKTAN